MLEFAQTGVGESLAYQLDLDIVFLGLSIRTLIQTPAENKLIDQT